MNITPSGLLKDKGVFLINAIKSVMLINLLLAVVALLKDMFLASYLGTSSEADAFLLAYFLPDTIGNNLLASSLGVACVPVFSRLYASKKVQSLNNSVTTIIIYFVLFSLLLTVFSIFAGDIIIGSLGAGFDDVTRALCKELFIIMLPILLGFPVVTTCTAIMQVYSRFVVPAMAPVLFNLVFLTGVFYIYFKPVPVQKGVFILAFCIVAGIMTMLALVCSAVLKYRIKVSEVPSFTYLIRPSDDIKEIFKIFFPYLLILVSSQAVFAVERYLASNMEVGTIAGLNYAFRMAQFPLWVFVAAVTAVAFPSMSRATGLGRVEELKGTFSKSLHMVFLVTVPLACCLFVLRVPIISILLQRGSFDGGSVTVTAGILAGYALTIIPQGIAIICIRAIIAAGRTYTPLLAVVSSSLLNILLDFLLADIAGPPGLGYGAAVGALANVVILYYLASRVLGLDRVKGVGTPGRILLANLPVYLVMVLFDRLWYLMMPENGLAARLAFAFFVVVAGLCVYLPGLRFLKIKTFALRDSN